MSTQHFDIVVVGAGLAGIGTACQLTTAHPDKSLALLERRQQLGGTWDLFRYPGIRSDADMTTLGYKFRPWTDPRVLADGESIRRYLADTAAEYGIDRKILYGLKIVSADWSSGESRWTVTAHHEVTGQTRAFTCSFLVCCTGYYDYDSGYLPDFAGLELFKGRRVHPQRWPNDLDYAGKDVIVIGSGATAVTVVPAMASVAKHVTMLQRSPSYVFSLPGYDKVSEFLERFLPSGLVWTVARRRNIVLQREIFLACRRWPRLSRRLLLWFMRRQAGPSTEMRHFTPKYMPWDERMCVASDGDLFKALKSGKVSIVTDEIETFTETGILLRSKRELSADIVVTATGLNLQMLGGMDLSVDGAVVQLGEKMAYKGVLVQDVPNFALLFGYTNAAYTLKADIAGAYLCRLFAYMDESGYTVATPHDQHSCATADGVFDDLQSGYVRRGRELLPRQGTKLPWKTLMHYEQDCRLLLDDPIDDGVLSFRTVPLTVSA